MDNKKLEGMKLKMKFNETPVRTSKKFGINDIELEDFEVPENIEKCICKDGKPSTVPLTYGVSRELEKMVYDKSNKKIKKIYDENEENQEKFVFELNKQNQNLLENIEFIFEENSRTDIIIMYMSDENTKCFHNGILRINAKKNSKANIVLINMLNKKTENFLSIENIVNDNACLNYTIVDFGGKTSITNYYSNIIGNNATSNLNTIYLGVENQVFDINYIAELKGKMSNADIEVQGALKDNAKKNFKGTIDFKKGCKNAKGNENEFCMLLSDTARSKALPMLLCTEEDVVGNHSSAAGKIEPKLAFYIMSRGFSYNETMKLIVKAKFNNIIDTIKEEDIRNLIIDEIDKKLGD